MDFSLKKATKTDSLFFYELKKMVLRKYVEEIWGWDEAFQVKFHDENYHPEWSYIIKVGNNNIGTVEIKEDNDRIFICSLYILPSWQGKGVGAAVIQTQVQKAQKEDKPVELEVLKSNTGAQRLYKRLGFKEVEDRGDENKIFMRKR